jgi:uncharacterized protein YbjT (DUF2867 family)
MRLPWANARVSYIDPLDVAEGAAHVLTTEGHVGKAYTLTCPEALSPTEVAEQMPQSPNATSPTMMCLTRPDAEAC